jgi:hypothetical protein
MRTFLILSLLLLSGQLFGQPLDRISKYLDSKHISQPAKDYYNGKFIAAVDDSRTLSILDSVATANHTARPFYLLLMSRMMKTADGALAAAIGLRCKDFVEQHPNQTISFLFNERGRKFLDSWGKTIAAELAIDCEEQPKACSRKSYTVAVQRVKPTNKKLLEQLYEKVALYCR